MSFRLWKLNEWWGRPSSTLVLRTRLRILDRRAVSCIDCILGPSHPHSIDAACEGAGLIDYQSSCSDIYPELSVIDNVSISFGQLFLVCRAFRKPHRIWMKGPVLVRSKSAVEVEKFENSFDLRIILSKPLVPFEMAVEGIDQLLDIMLVGNTYMPRIYVIDLAAVYFCSLKIKLQAMVSAK